MFLLQRDDAAVHAARMSLLVISAKKRSTSFSQLAPGRVVVQDQVHVRSSATRRRCGAGNAETPGVGVGGAATRSPCRSRCPRRRTGWSLRRAGSRGCVAQGRQPVLAVPAGIGSTPGGLRHPHGCGHGTARPMGRVARLEFQRRHDHPLDIGIGHRAGWLRPQLVVEAVDPLGDEPRTPRPRRWEATPPTVGTPHCCATQRRRPARYGHASLSPAPRNAYVSTFSVPPAPRPSTASFAHHPFPEFSPTHRRTSATSASRRAII